MFVARRNVFLLTQCCLLFSFPVKAQNTTPQVPQKLSLTAARLFSSPRRSSAAPTVN